jgi:hypothetical protein
MISPPLDISNTASAEDNLGRSGSRSASAASTASAKSTKVQFHLPTIHSVQKPPRRMINQQNVRDSKGYSQFMEPKYNHDYSLSRCSSTMEEQSV